MYIAELRGKFSPSEERMEDILTSDVFSFFKYANREIFLSNLLKLLGLKVSKSDLDEAEFNFWPSYKDHTEPDLVIIVGEYYLLVEAKFHSGFGKATLTTRHQLIREYEGGELEAQNLDKEFHLIAVTAHYAKHQFLAENSEYANKDVLWLNWHQIALLIYSILETTNTLDSSIRAFAEDLYDLLVKKNLRKYAGINILKSIRVKTSPAQLFFDSASSLYRGDFLGFNVSLEDTPKVQTFSDSIFYISTNNANDHSAKRIKKQTNDLEKPSKYFSFSNHDSLLNPPETIFFQEMKK